MVDFHPHDYNAPDKLVKLSSQEQLHPVFPLHMVTQTVTPAPKEIE